MRRLQGFLWTAGLLLALAACAPVAPVPTPTPSPPLPVAEPPLLDWEKDLPVPDFLDEAQQNLFRHARSAANFLMGCNSINLEQYPRVDGTVPQLTENWAETTELDGMRYIISIGRYRQWDDFQTMLGGLFTPAYQEELVTSEFMDGTVRKRFVANEDGLLCYLDTSRGSEPDHNSNFPDSFALVRQTEDEISFNLVGYYSMMYPLEGESYEQRDARVAADYEYTKSYPIRMEKTDMGWRFAEFHVAY